MLGLACVFCFLDFFPPEPCQYFLFTYERGYRISPSLHIEKGHFIPFLEGTAGEKHSRDSAPPHFFPGGRNDLADYCNWEREINTKTALQSSLSGNCLPAKRVLGICWCQCQSAVQHCLWHHSSQLEYTLRGPCGHKSIPPSPAYIHWVGEKVDFDFESSSKMITTLGIKEGCYFSSFYNLHIHNTNTW